MNIVLDLDSTLICTYEKRNAEEEFSKLKIYTENEDIAHRVYHFELEGGKFMWGVFRPGVVEFLNWAYSFFDNVIIWSAGVKSYVKKIVHILNNCLIDKIPNVVFYRDHCTNIKEDKIVKKLDQIFNNNILKNKISRENTILIDDNKTNHKYNVQNTILISAYQPEFTVSGILNETDRALLNLKEWFESIDKTKDIRFIKKIVF